MAKKSNKTEKNQEAASPSGLKQYRVICRSITGKGGKIYRHSAIVEESYFVNFSDAFASGGLVEVKIAAEKSEEKGVKPSEEKGVKPSEETK